MKSLEYARGIGLEDIEFDTPMLFQLDYKGLPRYHGVYRYESYPKTVDFDIRNTQGDHVALFRTCAEFDQPGDHVLFAKTYLENKKTGTVWAVILKYKIYDGGSVYCLAEFKTLEHLLFGFFARWDGSYDLFVTDLNFNWFHL